MCDLNEGVSCPPGCDSGFGQATARRLDSLGFQVFATVLDLNSSGAKDLQRSCSSLLTLLRVDITQQSHVQQALAKVQSLLGPRGEDSLPYS